MAYLTAGVLNVFVCVFVYPGVYSRNACILVCMCMYECPDLYIGLCEFKCVFVCVYVCVCGPVVIR